MQRVKLKPSHFESEEQRKSKSTVKLRQNKSKIHNYRVYKENAYNMHNFDYKDKIVQLQLKNTVRVKPSVSLPKVQYKTKVSQKDKIIQILNSSPRQTTVGPIIEVRRFASSSSVLPNSTSRQSVEIQDRE